MAIFVVVADSDNPAIGAAIAKNYPQDHYKLNGHSWLVSADTLSKTLSETIGLSDGDLGWAVVFAMDAYWGYHSNETWEWIKLKS